MLRVCSQTAVLGDEESFSSRFFSNRRRQYRDDDIAEAIRNKDVEKIPQITKSWVCGHTLKLIFLGFFFFSSLLAQEKSWNSFDYFPPMGVTYHPVSTSSREAQDFFNLGLLAIYAFNHDLAYRYFEKASEVDPKLAMAYWGMALTLGENINRPMTKGNEVAASQIIQKALSLRETDAMTEKEKRYIEACSLRYLGSDDRSVLRIAYKNAMEKLVHDYPDDLDAATLYAESLMNLRPWRLWTVDGKPEEGTETIVQVLESVIKRDPMHLGANHYYIHAVEASLHPEVGLMSAHRLDFLLPAWGHILHMPSHIYLLVGDYAGAARVNKAAVKADRAYIEKFGISGFYPIHYMSHNLYFLVRAYLWQEKYQKALQTALELETFLEPHIQKMPELEYYLLAPMQVFLYFHKWPELLSLSPPNPDLKGITAFWHFARATAYAALGNFTQGQKERELFYQEFEKIQPQERLGYNTAKDVLSLAGNLLEANFASGENSRLHFLEEAVKIQDSLHYNEPPDWFYPTRQTLGAHLLLVHEPQKAEEVFRAALEKLPRNGRSLFGLLEALKAQNRNTYSIERETKEALKGAEIWPTIKDL